MKDKTWYWILGLIAAYFLVRFIMNHSQGENHYVSKNDIDTDGKFRYGGHVEGEEGPTCKYCGSKTYYKKSFNSANPFKGDILRAVCSNPDCKSHSLVY